MSDVSQELMFEVLKSIQAEVRGFKEWRTDVAKELNAMRAHQAATQSDVNNLYSKLASMEVKLDRIEARLELTDTPLLQS